MSDLNARSQEILSTIVDMYTETGTPVGSKALVTATGEKLSSATIRNVMADLEKKGYLASPHTSAGRIPTESGFRYYAQSLVEIGGIKKELKDLVDQSVLSGKSFEDIVQNVSKVVGQMTGCASLITSPKPADDPLSHIEFLRLSGNRVLAVMVMRSGRIENRVINVPERISEEVLNASSKQLRSVVEGQTLSDARVSMMQALTEKKIQVDTMMNNMLASAEMWGEPTVTDGALVVTGSTNLFQYPELVRDQLKELVETFEEKRLLMALMDEVQKGEGVQIFVGKDCPIQAAKDCTMITSNYSNADKTAVGTLGVIGPMRMNYKQTIQVVDYTAQLLGRVLQQIKQNNEE